MNPFGLLQKTVIALMAMALVSCGSESEAPSPANTSASSASTDKPASTSEATDTVASLEQKVAGLWRYTGLRTGDGTDMPLTGIFLFKDDVFLQQATFNSEPFDQAGSMAHAGPYRAEPATGSVHLVAQQTISLDPTAPSPISFTPDTDHDVTVTRMDDDLTLIFGMGTSTVQEFAYIGPGEGEVYSLNNGAFALVDGHFVLVHGDSASVTSGYGTYTKEGNALSLSVILWSEADEQSATNLKDVTLEATFDGTTLVLADGRAFQVAG
ncbi:MAG: hypothetical protein AB8B96_20450 [Lysobacterales bacterium]